MFRIGEFSELTNVSKRMLRYYEKIGLFKPSLVDPFTNYRYYSDGDITKLEKISFFKSLGFSSHEIKTMLETPQKQSVTELKTRKNSLFKELKEVENEIVKLDMFIDSIQNDSIDIKHNFNIKKVDEIYVVSNKKKVEKYTEEEELWDELHELINKNNIKTTGKQFSIYDADANKDVEVCVEIENKDEVGKSYKGGAITQKKIKGYECMACTTIYGELTQIGTVYCDFFDWLNQNKHYTLSGASRHVFHRGPHNEDHKENYVTELQFEIKKLQTKDSYIKNWGKQNEFFTFK